MSRRRCAAKAGQCQVGIRPGPGKTAGYLLTGQIYIESTSQALQTGRCATVPRSHRELTELNHQGRIEAYHNQTDRSFYVKHFMTRCHP